MNKKKWIKLGLTVLLGIFSYSLRHKGQRECRSEQQWGYDDGGSRKCPGGTFYV